MENKTTIPFADAPIVRGDKITEAWFRFLLMLFNRTGASEGGDLVIIKQTINDLQAAVEGQDYGAAISALQAALSSVPPETLTGALIDVTASRIAELQAQIEAIARTACVPTEAPPADVVAALVRDEPPADVPVHGSLEGGILHAVATPAMAGFMSGADKAKLDALPAALPVAALSITADVTAANTTADINIFSATIPANSLAVGSSFLSSFTLFASAAGSSGTFNIWVKVGATKVLTATFTVPLVGLTNQAVVSAFRLNVRTIGGAGTFQVSGNNNGNSTLFTSGVVINTAAGSINTTVANTLSIGMNWSVANAANTASVKTGYFEQEK